jgi:hypothetical protein
MKTIPLYQDIDGRGPIVAHAIVDDRDFAHLDKWFWSLHPIWEEAFLNGGEYPVYMQNAVWERAGRKGLPKHISENLLDNRRENLATRHPPAPETPEIDWTP